MTTDTSVDSLVLFYDICHAYYFTACLTFFLCAEMKHNDLWRVGGGENSKEAGFQNIRNSREKETFYQTILDIPSNPKEPWDLEMDYDDSLTPEVLTEQLPDNESSETEVRNHVVDAAVPSEVISSQDPKPNADEPDLELLAVLLKNPELVYALTSSQAGNLPAEETVKLLDMIKASGASNLGSVNRMEKAVEKVEVSLPSPTPSSNAGTVRDLGSFCCCCKSTCKNVAYILCLTRLLSVSSSQTWGANSTSFLFIHNFWLDINLNFTRPRHIYGCQCHVNDCWVFLHLLFS